LNRRILTFHRYASFFLSFFCAWQWRDINSGLIDLFVKGSANPLPCDGRLEELGLGEGSVLFMLHGPGWRWETCEDDIVLGEEGLAATKDTSGWCLVTGGAPMTEGRHYWEVELTHVNRWCEVFVGAVRPGLDHSQMHQDGNDAYFIFGCGGALHGNGKSGAHPQDRFSEGDRVGVLLDLGAGWLRFYRNGVLCGPGYTEGVTGPLVRAAEVYNKGDRVTVLHAMAPEGAGAADEMSAVQSGARRTPKSEGGAGSGSQWGTQCAVC
jgi:hypothetical protein